MTTPLPEVEEFDESLPPRDQLLQWANAADGTAVREADLPAFLASLLAFRRADQPDRTERVLAFRVVHDGEETQRAGPETKLPSDGVVALSVVVTVADAGGVHVDAFSAALDEGGRPRQRRRGRPASA